MNEQNKFGTFSKEVALMLDISTSNLRKWSLLLEKEGYEFERNDKGTDGQRIYYERDINVLSQLKIILEKNRNIDDAIKAVMARVKEKDNVEKTLSVIRKNNDEITLSQSDLNSIIQEAVQDALHQQQSEFMKLVQGFQQVAATIQEEKRALPSPENVKSMVKEAIIEQYEEMTEEYRRNKEIEDSSWETRQRITMILRKEARELWEKKPESERFIKTGLFRKEEDVVKRSDFIQDYIDSQIIERFNEETKRA